jgi:virulence-associated protein VagC
MIGPPLKNVIDTITICAEIQGDLEKVRVCVHKSNMTQSTVLRTKNGQVVRMPKALFFPDYVSKVTITRQGNSLVVTPVATDSEEFFKRPHLEENLF